MEHPPCELLERSLGVANPLGLDGVQNRARDKAHYKVVEHPKRDKIFFRLRKINIACAIFS